MRAGRIGSSRALGSTCMGTPHTARDTLSTVCPKCPYTLSGGGVPKQTSWFHCFLPFSRKIECLAWLDEVGKDGAGLPCIR